MLSRHIQIIDLTGSIELLSRLNQIIQSPQFRGNLNGVLQQQPNHIQSDLSARARQACLLTVYSVRGSFVMPTSLLSCVRDHAVFKSRMAVSSVLPGWYLTVPHARTSKLEV